MRRFLANLTIVLAVVAVISAGIGLGIAAVVPGGVASTPDGPGTAGSLSSPSTPPVEDGSQERTRSPSPAASPTSSPSPTANRPVHIADVRAYDPLGDGHEHDSEVDLAVDDNPVTSWPTEHYSTPDFGGLKPGVGLLIDLGRPRVVSAVQLSLAGGGSALQLRAGRRAALGDLSVVAAVGNADPTTTFHPPRKRARYWLVWFTRLPPEGDHYRGGISEISFTGRK